MTTTGWIIHRENKFTWPKTLKRFPSLLTESLDFSNVQWKMATKQNLIKSWGCIVYPLYFLIIFL